LKKEIREKSFKNLEKINGKSQVLTLRFGFDAIKMNSQKQQVSMNNTDTGFKVKNRIYTGI
jgi:hypothetical protein